MNTVHTANTDIKAENNADLGDLSAWSSPIHPGTPAGPGTLLAGADRRARTATPASIAVLIPCHNEALSIAQVIHDFQQVLPSAKIYVYDNRSTDDTSTIAKNAGAIVRPEPWPGKGNVVRRMFADIDADVYIMADGDGTYDPKVAPQMAARLLSDHLDMVVNTHWHADHQGVFKALRQEFSGGFQRLRDRDRNVGARQPVAHADCRDADRIRRAPGWFDQQAAHLS